MPHPKLRVHSVHDNLTVCDQIKVINALQDYNPTKPSY